MVLTLPFLAKEGLPQHAHSHTCFAGPVFWPRLGSGWCLSLKAPRREALLHHLPTLNPLRVLAKEWVYTRTTCHLEQKLFLQMLSLPPGNLAP